MKGLPSTWTTTTNAPSRQEAIERTYDYYDSHRGRRRLPARDAFDIYRAVKLDANDLWKLWMRKR